MGNIVDPSWWTDLIGEKSGAYDRARKPNKFKEWKLKQPLWKQFFIEVLMFTLIALAFNKSNVHKKCKKRKDRKKCNHSY